MTFLSPLPPPPQSRTTGNCRKHRKNAGNTAAIYGPCSSYYYYNYYNYNYYNYYSSKTVCDVTPSNLCVRSQRKRM